MAEFYARHFSVSQFCDDSAHLLAVAVLPLLPPKGRQLPIAAWLADSYPGLGLTVRHLEQGRTLDIVL